MRVGVPLLSAMLRAQEPEDDTSVGPILYTIIAKIGSPSLRQAPDLRPWPRPACPLHRLARRLHLSALSFTLLSLRLALTTHPMPIPP